jgi:hypothetical protein
MALMTLMNDEMIEALPSLYSTEKQPEGQRMIQFKYFDPCGSWTWYAMEFDPDTNRFFGLVDGNSLEYGYFSLDELMQYEGPLGIGIELDLHYTPITARKQHEKCLKARGGHAHC